MRKSCWNSIDVRSLNVFVTLAFGTAFWIASVNWVSSQMAWSLLLHLNSYRDSSTKFMPHLTEVCTATSIIHSRILTPTILPSKQLETECAGIPTIVRIQANTINMKRRTISGLFWPPGLDLFWFLRWGPYLFESIRNLTMKLRVHIWKHYSVPELCRFCHDLGTMGYTGHVTRIERQNSTRSIHHEWNYH